jgi:hypothetical protein
MLSDTIKSCLSSTPASAGMNLRGFGIDLSYHLEHLGIFSRVRTRLTEERLCLLSAECTLAPLGLGLAEAAQAAADLWNDRIAYEFFSAYEIVERSGGVDIDFVTSTGKGPGSLCVTGTIAIRFP